MMPTSAARPAAVAGLFYPSDARRLRDDVDAYLRAGPVGARSAQAPAAASTSGRPKVLIVPHAGYVYSGAVAGQAYARLRPHAPTFRRVVLLGPAHRVALRGLALPAHDALATPLGRVAVDPSARQALAGLPQVGVSAAAHADEHALEVQLPFLQRVLGEGFVLVPLVVGDASARDVAEVLERLWGGDETLIVISSDLSHYLSDDQARARDGRTVERIAAGATDLDVHDACGARALNGALLAAARHGMRPVLVDQCNSGDTAGDRRRVVGYAAFVAGPAPDAQQDVPGTDAAADRTGEAGVTAGHASALGAALLSRARNTIATRLGHPGGPEPDHPALAAPGATFVTLTEADGRLRGCIGRLEPDVALDTDVRRNAAAAAFADPRFAPLRAPEWPGLQVSVSLVGPHESLPAQPSAADAARTLRPGRDGVILAWRGRRATFLPQVWDQLPRGDDFIAALLHKAGLPDGFWAHDVALWRYGVQHFKGATSAPEAAT